MFVFNKPIYLLNTYPVSCVDKQSANELKYMYDPRLTTKKPWLAFLLRDNNTIMKSSGPI